jgi:hypothetical protein
VMSLGDLLTYSVFNFAVVIQALPVFVRFGAQLALKSLHPLRDNQRY